MGVYRVSEGYYKLTVAGNFEFTRGSIWHGLHSGGL